MAVVNLAAACILLYGQQTTVVTPQCTIDMHKRSIAYIEQFQNTTTVYCLHQSWFRQIQIDTQSAHYNLAPGYYLSIGGHSRYLGLISKSAVKSQLVYSGKFSIFTALHTIPRLKKFTLNPEEDSFLNKVLLTVCILRDEGKKHDSCWVAGF